MAVVNATGTVLNLDGFQSYAQPVVRKNMLEASQYNRSPIFAMMTGRGGNGGPLGRPGAWALLGGSKNLTEAQKQSMAGDTAYKIRLLTNTSDGGRFLTARGTTPDVDHSQDQNGGSASFSFCHYMQPIKVWNETLREAQGAAKIGEAVAESTAQATEVMWDKLSKYFYLGNPTSQTDTLWDMPLGLVQMCDDNNTYGNVNRSTTTMWAGRVVATAPNAQLDLIDDANFTQSAAKNGPGVDTVLCSFANYLKFKKEALARGGSIVHGGMPRAAEVGIRDECIEYGRSIIVADPFLADWSSDTTIPSAIRTDISAYVFMLHLKQVYFAVQSGENFRVTKFVDQGEEAPGNEDATTASIRARFRIWTPRPWNHVLYTSVS